MEKEKRRRTEEDQMVGALIREIHKELHARVAEPVLAPCRIRHSAYLLPDHGSGVREEVQKRFEDIVKSLEIPESDILWGERSGRVETPLPGNSRLRVVWEVHSEFYSYTTVHLAEPGKSKKTREQIVPSFTFPAMPALGTKLVDLDIAVLNGRDLTPALEEFLGPGTIYGGNVLEGQSRVWTTFQVDDWGQGKYLIRAGDLSRGRLGRLIRRLVEIENYYHLILQHLDEYRLRVSVLQVLEKRLSERSEEIADVLGEDSYDTEREHTLLVDLTRDFSELANLTEMMRHKFSAADSYYAIFTDRLHWLREHTGEGHQALEEFLMARISPAIRSYRNFLERADILSSQITSLGNMLRTRISLSMERQSLKTMQAMNKRVELQLLLQRTVEGLSVIVLTYYLMAITGYLAKAADSLWGLPGKPILWTAGSLPLWALIAWKITHRVKHIVKDFTASQREIGGRAGD
ncbi:MAG: DUF3422 domain-containing protein [Deltaproteobacteria bacterium]|nr:DUF3422 domain-containing protein [Deltaproteobacteria bacterium]